MKKSLFGLIMLMLVSLLTGCGNGGISNTELRRAMQDAQEKRVQELTDNLAQQVGEWKSGSLFCPLTIGQDSTRNQLGIELSDVDFQIREDYSVKLNDEEYEILAVDIMNYDWYINAYCQGPAFAEGLIVEITYKDRQEGRKRFSICVAENGMYLCSYAYGYYQVQKKDHGSETDKIELNQEVADKVNEAYERRYGAASEPFEALCGEWQGGIIVPYEGYTRIEGEHTLEIQSLNFSQIKFCFDGKPVGDELVETIAIGTFSETQYWQTLDIPREERDKMRIYAEGFGILLKEEDKPVILFFSRDDYEDRNDSMVIKLYYNGDTYRLERIE